MKLLRSAWIASLWSLRGVGTVMLWTLWLGLGGLLAIQTYIASTSELAVPDFLLRRLERQIEAYGVNVTFGRTSFDPHGRVLIEDVRFTLPGYEEPILSARAVYAQFDPWLLAIGRVEPQQLRVTGVAALVPARLTPSGRGEQIVRDLDAVLVPVGKHLAIPQLSAYVGNVVLTARGSIALPARKDASAPDLGEIAARFPDFSRRAMTVMGQLDALEAPTLHLELSPHETGIATAEAVLFARRLTLDTPLVARIEALQIATRGPLLGNDPTPTRLELVAAEMSLPFATRAQGVRASLLGGFREGGGYRFEPTELRLTADAAESAGFSAEAFSALLTPKPLPQLDADITMRLLDAPLAVQAEADFSARSAVLRFSGALSPRVLDPLSARLKADVRKWFDFAALAAEAGEVRLGPEWKFERLDARVALRGIDAYNVPMEEGRATIALTPTRLHAPEVFARIGTNFARGSYEQDLRTREFRFLLDGQLRPLDISGWFQSWWPNFFKQLDFTAAAPVASVDVGGVWREGRQSRVFVFADVAQPVVRGVALDRVRTRLFIRPGYYDGLELLATSGERAASGTFTYALDAETFDWRSLDLDVASTLDPALAARMIGPAGERVLEPFAFAQPPTLKLAGRFTSAHAPEGEHQALTIGARTAGTFRVYDFPLEDATFTATLRDDTIDVDDVTAQFAGGALRGRARIFGTGEDRRVSFDASLKEAALGAVATTLQEYSARQQGRPPPPPGKFVQEKANVRIDLTAVGAGKYGAPLSYEADGAVALSGAEIGEVPLLGLLSEVLRFSTLRFTSATSKFKLAGAKIEFPDVVVRGANSSIEAEGNFALDRKALDFKARIFPFQESDGLIKTVVGAVLTPFSNVFEVKLSGSLEKPEWALTLDPTNILRSLVPGEESAPGAAANPAAAPPLGAATPPTAGGK